MTHDTPESSTQRACLDLLTAHKIWHRRWNTGAIKADKRFFRFGRPGDGDILATPIKYHGMSQETLILWIEVKSSTGRQSTEQKQFEKEVLSRGHYYLLVRDVDELIEWLRIRGLI